MTSALRAERRQGKAFTTSLEQEVHISIARTEAALREHIEQVLKPFGISVTQYNVLRVLRGAGEGGLCRNEIRDRLIDRMPDVTRLLDRMEETGWITRIRGSEDRRQVSTFLTKTGRDLVNALDAPIEAEHARHLGHLTRTQLRTLLDLLNAARKSS